MLARLVLCLFLFRGITSIMIEKRANKLRSPYHTFNMGKARVTYFKPQSGSQLGSHALKKRGLEAEPAGFYDDPSMKPIDLTPAKCSNSTCYPGTFQPPSLEDCEVVIQAQLYNSTGSLQASPGTWVFVSYGTCATVFQNPEESGYTLQYNWAELGAQAGTIAGRCMLDEHEYSSMGGVCVFEKYLKYKFEGVMISLQRFDESDLLPN